MPEDFDTRQASREQRMAALQLIYDALDERRPVATKVRSQKNEINRHIRLLHGTKPYQRNDDDELFLDVEILTFEKDLVSRARRFRIDTTVPAEDFCRRQAKRYERIFASRQKGAPSGRFNGTLHEEAFKESRAIGLELQEQLEKMYKVRGIAEDKEARFDKKLDQVLPRLDRILTALKDPTTISDGELRKFLSGMDNASLAS